MFIGHRYWYIACPSSELKQKPVSAILASIPLVIFRTASHQVAALENRCAHRHAPMSAGKVCQESIQCPYHGWEYDINGTVTRIPALPSDSKIPSNLNIKKYHCLEQDGYVWVCLAETPATSHPVKFPYLDTPGWTTFRMKTRFLAPVDTCLENFLDCPHATFVHRFWFRTPQAKPVKAIVQTLPDGAVAEYLEEPRESAVVWWLLSQNRAQMQHTDRFIAPATSRVDYIFSDQRHYIITSACTPIGDRQTEVHTVITFRFPVIGWLIKLLFAPLSRFIIQQDVKMIKMQQANINRFPPTNYKFTPADLLLPYILKWRQSDKCNENSNSPPPPAGIEHHIDIML
ncbi:aromatic ring-hydroxylating dioxygenase subunit alpha [Nodularia harveyana UHCC-0300]|uniref:Aromatic ring-hydroxylating dioxygenase subunit alpha n=1 Tax=Nodularia harveyana UHCC-0300 TaxID=2974287 RepID=A0ABU5UDZ3_9CYAN|nr:aromatic ring-hydroxylating dioxygenase subunit alpha [Nodularia harveyana]MEA5581226.1 aromatic ring-hydroxylating dioxygenase subunit alpha [Nodularia harveyana UHCC-0300]